MSNVATSTLSSFRNMGSAVREFVDSRFTVVSSNSASWDTAYTTVTANSASWASGGGGAYASNTTVSTLASGFSGTIPDAILLTDTSTGSNSPGVYVYTFSGVNVDNFLIMYRTYDNTSIDFNNNSTGTYNSKTTSHILHTGDSTLQDVINNGHAIYYK